MIVEKVIQPSQELVDALQHLVAQLGIHKAPPTIQDLASLLASEGSTLLVAREPDRGGEIIGILSLTVYHVPTGTRSIVEDVVVDERMRRQGVGAALIRRAIDLAREAGANGVALTSNPRREAANRLYLSLGFELRQTNAYFFRF